MTASRDHGDINASKHIYEEQSNVLCDMGHPGIRNMRGIEVDPQRINEACGRAERFPQGIWSTMGKYLVLGRVEVD